MKKILPFALATMLTLGCASPAFALEYEYESNTPGDPFYRATSVDSNYLEHTSDLVIGIDGTIAADLSGLATSSPLSVLDIPIGDYPDSWGPATDEAIAQNSVFPNFIAPTTQQSMLNGFLAPDPLLISSGAIPTLYNGYVPHLYNYASWGWALPTANRAMPAITSGGAIGRLSIPSIGLDRYVYEGTTQSNMAKGVAHFDCTPGWGGNIAFASHNRGGIAVFAKLKDVQLGDTVTYTTAYGTATYVINDVATCATTDTTGLLQDGTNKLTMYTCKMNQPEVKLRVTAVLVP